VGSNTVEDDDVRRHVFKLPDGRDCVCVSLPKETCIGIPGYKGNNAPKDGGLHRRPISLQCGIATIPVAINIGECDEESLTERRREMDYFSVHDIEEEKQQ